MAGIFLSYLLLKNWMLRITVVLVAILVALLGNFMRSLYLALVAYRGGLKALETAHDAAGWSVLALTAVLVSLCAIAATRIEMRVNRMQAESQFGPQTKI